MPIYQFEAMDATGQEIKDQLEAQSEEEAQATIRQMGYFITRISVTKTRKSAAEKKKA
ncbi:MAG: type II secretion system F family protein, partial [Planctomycetaceae bacterium]|nr:type II secretion system F family protein [Planctomycetaceae bacterium]